MKKTIFIAVVCLLSLFPQVVHAGDMSAWTYERSVVIDNTSNTSALANYQVVITLNSASLIAAGNMQADGSDIRFTETQNDDTTLLSHWVETPTINTAATRIWVKIPALPASSTKTIYLYYGNGAVTTTSSISNTFIFGDDFSGGALDITKWAQDTGQFTVSGGYLSGGNTNYYIQSTTTASNPIIIETRTRANALAPNGQSTLGFWVNSSNNIGLLEHAGGSPSRYWYRNNGSWVGPTDYDFFNWHKAKITIDAGGSGELYVINANQETTTKTFTNTVSNEALTLGMRYDNGLYNQSYNQDWDWIFAREYTATEPAVNPLFPITQLVFTTDPQTVYEDHASAVMTVQTQDETNAATAVAVDTTIDLSSTSGSGQFSLTDSPFVPLTSVTIPAGTDSVSFYYRDSSEGAWIISAAESPTQGWAPAAQTVTISAAVVIGKYKIPYTVQNLIASDLADYQILITLDTLTLIASAKMNADGSDIKFLNTDDLTPLSHWVETPTINTTATRIWVRLPTLSASANKIIYLYYGDISATSTSSISNTFIFGDDFSGGALDITKWAQDTGQFTVSGGYLSGGNTNYYIQSTTTASNPIIIETRTRANALAPNGQSTLGFWVNSSNNIGLLEHAGGSPSRYWYRNNGSWVGPTDYDFFNWHKAKITIDAAGSGELYVINANQETTAKTFTNTVSNEALTLGMRYDNGLYNQSYNQDWDWIFARKYAGIEPSVNAGSEQNVISRLVFSTNPQTLIQNQASLLMTVEAQDFGGTAQTVSVDTDIQLESSSIAGSFAPEDSPWNWSSASTLTITILAGDSSASFYYKDTAVGTPVITASEYPSQGWTDAQQQQTVNSAVDTFLIAAGSTQVAGSAFTLMITAIGENGQVSTDYSEPVDISVNYVAPATGSGALSVTSTAAFVSGVALISDQTFSDCGTVTISATKADDPTKTGTSNNIVFVPYDFTVVASDLNISTSANQTHTVSKPFTLTVTARNASLATCLNYKGTADLSVNYVNPSTDQAGALSTASLTSAYWTNGVAEGIDMTYDKWGTITITVTDEILETQTGTSSSVLFIPKDFALTLSDPPPLRTFYYLEEDFSLTVAARDYQDNTVSNYSGTVTFSGLGLSLPENYTFVEQDAGSALFEKIFGTTAIEETLIRISDTSHTDVTGISDPLTIQAASIRVFSDQGPVGDLLLTVAIIDEDGDIITEDYSTSFLVELEEIIEDLSATSETTTQPMTMTEGQAIITVKDDQAETVTVIPASTPELEAVSGTATFGTISGSGMGIQFFRELKDGKR